MPLPGSRLRLQSVVAAAAALVLAIAGRLGWSALTRRREAAPQTSDTPAPSPVPWAPPWRQAAPLPRPSLPMAVSRRRAAILLIILVLTVGAGTAVYALVEKSRRWEEARWLTGGEPEHAPQLIVRYGCGGCHTIPGVAMAHGQVGPNLEGVGARVYIAGRITNTPDHMIAFITNPSALAPGTAMPVTGISQEEAADIAAFLYAAR